MELQLIEEKPGVYTKFQSSEGYDVVVLRGLSLNTFEIPNQPDDFFERNYDTLSLMYWCLFFITLSFIVYKNIVKPLWQKHHKQVVHLK